MQYIPWDKHFETGIPEVDRQHKSLFDLLNRVGDLLMRSDPVPLQEIEGVFNELQDYAKYHFHEEERIMFEVGIDPLYLGQHIRLHVNFLQDLVRMRAEMGTRGYEGADLILKFLTYWLAFHILGQDQSTARQIRAIERGTSPLAAFKAEETVRQGGTEPLLHALAGLFQQVMERNRELCAFNRKLEEKVQERTCALQKANRRLEEMALTDVLTGLPNRRHAMSRLAEEWKRAEARGEDLSVMMVDADGFKQINDAHGHEAGDAVLRKLAHTLRSSVRTDDLVCRLGGDEFLVLCPSTAIEGVLQAAESLRMIVAELRVPARKGVWNGSISVGVAARTPEMTSPEDLIRAADEGVYLAKARGRNAVAFAEDFHPASRTTRESQRPSLHRTSSDARRPAVLPRRPSGELRLAAADGPVISFPPQNTH
ncbi:MAG: GGDEF domain-containing protein [Polyangiaceae bacterium]